MNRIAEIREAAALTQSDLAEKLGCHWITISRLERGEMQLTHEWMIKLAQAMGAKPFQFVLDAEDMDNLAALQALARGASS